VLVVHLGSTLEETGVQVENVTGVGLTTRGTTEQQRHLTVSDGLLGKIVVDDDSMAAVVTEPLTHGTASEGSEVLQRSGLRSSGSNDNGVLHGVILLKGLDELSDSGTFLANGNVDTVELLALVGRVVPSLLVKHSIESNSGLTSLTVTNDQLTLTTADGDHGVDTLQTSLDRLVDGTTGQDTRGLELSTALGLGVDGALAINGVTKGVNDTPKEFGTDRNVDNLSSTLDSLTLLDETVGTEKHNTDLAGFQVHAHTLDTRGELDQLLSLDIGHTMDTSDTVTDGKDTSSLSKASLFVNTTNSLLKNGGNLCGRSLGLSSVGTDLLGGTGEGAGNSRANRGDSASGSGSRNGAARLPQSVPEHCDGGSEVWESGFSEGEI
jgi:hypothetical protein